VKCPHCHEGIHEEWGPILELGQDAELLGLALERLVCPECLRHVVRACERIVIDGFVQERIKLLHPHAPTRPVPPELEGEYAEDFREACAVLSLSPKASAAISRRLVQHVLREKAGVKKANLDQEIKTVLDEDLLPADLAEDLDAIRTIGNFSAHPVKSTDTGAVVDVEPGEAEWLLDVLEELLEYYFVRPAKREAKRQALNEKLNDTGKPPLKEKPEQAT
jgi:hypothetical protein